MRRRPIPRQYSIGTKFEETPEDDVSREVGGEGGHENAEQKQQVLDKESAGGPDSRGSKGSVGQERLNEWEKKENTVGIIDI